LFLVSGFIGSGIYGGIEIWDMLTRDKSADAYWSCMAGSPQASFGSGGFQIRWRSFAEADRACGSLRPFTLSRDDAQREWMARTFP